MCSGEQQAVICYAMALIYGYEFGTPETFCPFMFPVVPLRRSWTLRSLSCKYEKISASNTLEMIWLVHGDFKIIKFLLFWLYFSRCTSPQKGSRDPSRDLQPEVEMTAEGRDWC